MLFECCHDPLRHISIQVVVARTYHYVVALCKISYLVQRLSHLYPQGLGFVATRHDTAVVVAQYNNRFPV